MTTSKLSQEQRRHLLERISRVYSGRSPLKETQEVRAARRVIAKFNALQMRARQREQSKYQKAIKVAKEAVLFKDERTALAAVKRLEKQFAPPGKKVRFIYS